MRALDLLDRAVDAGANLFDVSLGGGVLDETSIPRSVIDSGPQRTVYRYRRGGGARGGAPVLLIPPLAAPASCFDLRRGASLAEHLLALGYPTYLVDYGAISFSDRALGLEHWVQDVIPAAVRAVSADAGGREVQLVGWCLGGIMALLAVAGGHTPARTVSLIASPFDFDRLRMAAPIRQLAELTGGRLGTALYRALGGAPAPLVSLGFQLTALDKRLTKPLTLVRNAHDRDLLAHIAAVDRYMAGMLAYPGRTFGQLYHRFFRVNDLADGRIELSGRVIDLADVRVPVLAVAGETDVLAPVAAVHHVGSLLSGSPEVVLATAPGGHLGVLTGRSARHTTWARLDEFLAAHDVAGTTRDVAEAGWSAGPAPAEAA
jgi:poly[(R)-3-hydroxyalkanoate] polymerase subunit PhaC